MGQLVQYSPGCTASSESGKNPVRLSAQCSVDRTRTAKFFDLLEAGRLMAVRTDGKNFPRNGVRTVWPSTGLFQVPNICSRA